jgi:DNA-binding transcriptional MerR regulator/effector-binding domain-containing protein
MPKPDAAFMADNRLFSVGDFAKFSRTTRDTLHHYDKIGLLSPISRGENSYRYYSSGQLSQINVIRILQNLGLSLTEIKALKDNRTPEIVSEVLMRQIEQIDSKINDWVQARKLLFTLQKAINSVLSIDEQAITIQFMPAEAIILGELNDYSRGKNDYDALYSFYHDINKKYPNLDMNYPVWGVFSEDRIKRGDYAWPDRYYFYNPEGHDKRPASLYAVGYTRGGYGQGTGLYNRIINYINRNDFEICGNAFEEYPLNEFCILDDRNYLMRVMITVREKK